jgi:hypothetical protein
LKAPTAPPGGPATGGSFVFLAGGSREAFDDYTIRAEIPLSETAPGVWQKVTLYYGRGKREIHIAGRKIPGSLDYRESSLQETFTYIAFYADMDGASFSLDEICMEESVPGFWGNAGTTFTWREEKPLLVMGSYPVIENVFFETAVESGARGAAAVDENMRTESAFESRTRAQATVFKTDIGGHFNYGGAANKENAVWSGGHSVNRAFGPFAVREAFSIDPDTIYWDHNAGVSLRGSVPVSFEARSREDRIRLSRSWDGNVGLHAGSFLLQTGLSAQWRYPSQKYAETGDYGYTWTESWSALKPDAGPDAQERTLKGNITTSFGGEAIGVVFTFTPSQTARKLTDNAASATNASLSFPWTAGNYSGDIVFARAWNSVVSSPANDAGGDILQYGESLRRGRSHLLSIPVYALFAEEIAAMPQDSSVLSESFADSGALSLTLPRRDDVAALVIPRAVETKLERAVSQRYDTLTDTFDFNVLARFSAEEIFGAHGKIPLFRFYQADEFNTALSYHLRLPKREDAVWSITLDQDFWFFGFYGSNLSLGDTVSITSSGNIYALTLSWTAIQQENLPGKILSLFINRFSENTFSPSLAFFANAGRVFQRVEKLKYTYNGTGDNPVTTLSLGHESIVRITGHLQFSLFANLDIADDKNAEITNWICSAGTLLRVIF